MPQLPIAIVGAGLAGLAAARALAAAGLSPRLFDKSRGVGGRMATRRREDTAIDHGAPHVPAALGHLLAGLVPADLLVPWEATGELVATPGMSALPKALAAGLEVRAEATVKALRGAPGAWHLVLAEDTAPVGPFAAVLVTTPAPQAIPLLGPHAGFGGTLGVIGYDPCWTVLVTLAAPLPGPAFSTPGDTLIAVVSKDSAKPGRRGAPPTLVAHATPAWTRANLERAAPEVAADLVARLRDIAGLDHEPVAAVGHRWRYARVSRPLLGPCLFDEETGLGFAGDGCLGPDATHAVESGFALAERVARALT